MARGALFLKVLHQLDTNTRHDTVLSGEREYDIHVIEPLVKVDGELTHYRAFPVRFLLVSLGHLVLCRWMGGRKEEGKKIRKICPVIFSQPKTPDREKLFY